MSSAMAAMMEEMLMDPITNELMLRAVVTPSGHTFEESVIHRIIRERGTNPMTREPLRIEDLRPALNIRLAAEEYQKAHADAGGSSSGDPEIDAVRTKLNETWLKTSEFLVIDSVERAAVSTAVQTNFEQCRRSSVPLKNQMHGTKLAHLDGIQKNGFRVPVSNERDDGAESKLRFGCAIYTTDSSSKASTYGDKVILVCDVVPGRQRTLKSTYEEMTGDQMRRDGYDSVLGELDNEPNERAFYDPGAVIPRFVVKYHTVGMDKQPLPSEIPRTDVPTLVKFLGSTERHQELAMRYLGDCFRDMTRATCHSVFDATRVDAFFGAIARGLRSSNENLNLHSLRILWNMSYSDRPAQRVVLERINVDMILVHVRSVRETNQMRGAAVIANLCHLETENHGKVLKAMPEFGEVVMERAEAALKKQNAVLAVRLLTSVANLAASGASFLDRRLVGRAVDLMDSPLEEVQEQATRIVTNVISKGEEETGWAANGHSKATSVKKE